MLSSRSTSERKGMRSPFSTKKLAKLAGDNMKTTAVASVDIKNCMKTNKLRLM